jgi:hypothetical protein
MNTNSYSSNELYNQDIETFIKYTIDKLYEYEDKINEDYVNIRSVISNIEVEFPMIDITSNNIKYIIYLFFILKRF